MNITDFINLQYQITYQGKKCIDMFTYDTLSAIVPKGYIYIVVFIHAKDVDNDKWTRIGMSELVQIAGIEQSTLDSHLSYFKDILCLLQMHEVQETFAINGNRVFNPHNLNGKITKLNAA